MISRIVGNGQATSIGTSNVHRIQGSDGELSHVRIRGDTDILCIAVVDGCKVVVVVTNGLGVHRRDGRSHKHGNGAISC